MTLNKFKRLTFISDSILALQFITIMILWGMGYTYHNTLLSIVYLTILAVNSIFRWVVRDKFKRSCKDKNITSNIG